MHNFPAVVVLSGGQDSVTCLGLAIQEHGVENIQAVSFDYGQRHATELLQAVKICEARGIPHRTVALPFLPKLVTSALTGDGDVSAMHAHKPGLPASFVPNRNALFLVIAHALAQEVGARRIYIGVCMTDYSGYPDCRDQFVMDMERALNRGYETEIDLVTPLMYLTKAETFALAETVGFLDVVVEDSHTCYNGDREHRHDWGYGCGQCPACQLREKGWNEFQASKVPPEGFSEDDIRRSVHYHPGDLS